MSTIVVPRGAGLSADDSSRLLASVIESVPDAVYVIDRDHRWVLVNSVFCDFLGKKRCEILGNTAADLCEQSTAAALREQDESAFLHDAEEAVQVVVRPADGALREVSFRRNRHTDGLGCTFVIGVLRDITEQNQASRAARDRDQILDEIQALSNVGHLYWSAQSGKMVWSRQLYQIYGMDPSLPPPEESFHRDMMLPGEWQRIQAFLRQAFETNQPAVFEYRIRRPDGGVRTLVANVRWRLDVSGALFGLAGAVQDVTLQAATADARRKSEALHRMIAENVADGIWIMDLGSLRITYASPAVFAISGYTPDELEQMSITDILTPSSLERVMLELQSATAAARTGIDVTHRLEIEERKKNGETVWVEVSARVMRDADGAPREILGVTREITERRRSREILEGAIAQAEEASRIKSRLVSNVSHEIRTPLNAIIGFAELVLEDTVLDEAKQRAQVILRESEVLLALVNELLDHAKLEEGRLELCPEPTDLRALLGTVERSSGLQAARKGLDFQLVMGADVPGFVNCDALRLRQILQNLVNNALKFTERGSVSVAVDCVQASDRRVELKFVVNDTGIGIPPERQEAIFESFVQADARTTRRYGGTGLGTTIARQLVEHMGGRLQLESHVGYGSTFWFSAWFDTVDSEDPALRSSRLVRLVDGSSGQPQARILVAEDYPVNHRILREHLESAGHRVSVVENGQDAVSACAQKPFDLVLMDLQMPQMDGLEATRRIRGLPGRAGTVPIFGVTASAEASTRRECVTHGMTGVLTKPIRKGPLLEAVELCLARSRPATEDTPPNAERAPAAVDCEACAQAAFALAQGPALDIPGLVEQFGGKADLAWSVAREFSIGLGDEVAVLRSLVISRQMEQVRRRAHRIKGGASSLCASMVAELAGRIELAAACTRLSEVESLIPELETAHRELLTAVAATHDAGADIQ